jgi:uncharacterized RDD family membrane protein YckC
MSAVAAGNAQQIARRVHGQPAVEAPPEIVYAGFVTRTIAFAVDALVIDVVALAVAAVVALVFSVFPVSSDVHNVAVAAGGVLFVIWSMAYFTTFWTSTGQTPGARAMTIRVMRADGSRLRPRHALVRLVGLVVSLPLLFGYLPILVTDRRRGLFDVMAGTVVIESQTPA